MDGYLLLRALHITAVVAWIGGMLANSLTLAHAQKHPTVLRAMHLWDSHVSNGAMALTWILGITLAIQGGWFSQGWLHVKFLIVLALSALHGMQSAGLRRLSNGGKPPRAITAKPWLPLGALLVIALLAVTKPF
ncbi:CopD family protein [Roseomonas sp. 18066]|uniref:CopD family protein n=1 Tax=Roseomonas sp. 18066 TaxID=2681412 RepID=UPI0013586FA8|nr:CopD family protein [Roseomonas sp. 18066]